MRDALLHILKDVEEAINIERGLSIIVTRVCMTLGTEVCSIYVTDPSTILKRLVRSPLLPEKVLSV